MRASSLRQAETRVRWLLLISVLHVALSVFIPAVPGWKMFVHVVDVEYRMLDSQGSAVRLPDLGRTPRYLTGPGAIRSAAAWLARSRGGSVVLSLRTAGGQEDRIYDENGSRGCSNEEDACAGIAAAWEQGP